MTNAPMNRNGGLTLVPLRGFEAAARRIKILIEERGAREGERETPVDIATPRFDVRPSGESFVRLGKQHVGEHDCVVIGSGPGSDSMIMHLLWTLSYLTGRHARRIALITGYFPMCRSDKDEGDTELPLPPMLVQLARAACGDIGLYRWVCMDPHSDQISMAGPPGKVTPVYLTRRLLKGILEQVDHVEQVCLAFPDDSARKRFESARGMVEDAQNHVFPDVLALKRRYNARKIKIVGIVGERQSVEGRQVILLDDEIATGSSMITFAQILKDQYGAREVWAAATHGVLCGSAGRNFTAKDCPIDKVIVTNTIPLPLGGPLEVMRDAGRLRVLDIEADMAWVIYNHHWDENIREVR